MRSRSVCELAALSPWEPAPTVLSPLPKSVKFKIFLIPLGASTIAISQEDQFTGLCSDTLECRRDGNCPECFLVQGAGGMRALFCPEEPVGISRG